MQQKLGQWGRMELVLRQARGGRRDIVMWHNQSGIKKWRCQSMYKSEMKTSPSHLILFGDKRNIKWCRLILSMQRYSNSRDQKSSPLRLQEKAGGRTAVMTLSLSIYHCLSSLLYVFFLLLIPWCQKHTMHARALRNSLSTQCQSEPPPKKTTTTRQWEGD